MSFKKVLFTYVPIFDGDDDDIIILFSDVLLF